MTDNGNYPWGYYDWSSTIYDSDVRDEAERRAWERAGFESREHLYQTIRDLPLDDRVDLLTELFLTEISTLYFRRYVKFQESLGKNLYVTKEEMIEYAKKINKDANIREDTFGYTRISPETLKAQTVRNMKKTD